MYILIQLITAISYLDVKVNIHINYYVFKILYIAFHDLMNKLTYFYMVLL